MLPRGRFMSKRSAIPQSRRHIWIRDADWKVLSELPGTPSQHIRELVSRYVAKLLRDNPPPRGDK